jgi:hypothetical protein
MSPQEYFRRYQQQRTPEEQLRESMRRKASLLRPDFRVVLVPGALRTPFNCIEVVALLFLAGTCCVVASIAIGGIFGGVSAVLSIPSWIPLATFIAPLGACVAIYAVVLRHSAWFFRLTPALRWAASVVSAVALTCLFVATVNLLFLSLL